MDGKIINEQARSVIEDDPEGEVSSIRDLFSVSATISLIVLNLGVSVVS